MQLADIVKELNDRLSKPFSARVLLDNLRLITEDSRRTSAYTDPLFMPFYYHLGQVFEAKNILEIGFQLGLCSACFLKARPVEQVLGFQEKGEEYYSPRLGKANVMQNAHRHMPLEVYVGGFNDPEFLVPFQRNKWDLCFINEETGYDKHLAYLDFVWPQMELDGLMVMDYLTRHTPAQKAYFDFCKSKNREPVTFKTRYGVGIIQR